ncbi:G patch domain-containing protein 4 isoform X1 [Brienomyrus brachyistius]|uniref:G patch domain-containing protein 4 isoform X1 n=1 Tax=Brienomyrus brachyistius TaxID=42636 RepID=UPI0020B1E336|nr:G patch domain-containing protein 4 isoform X1 [Brienomyrus brachyistius]XP_048880621.1 G patch domain-containing protein 4 isoform X1 [Brienomyrus brachyistius]
MANKVAEKTPGLKFAEQQLLRHGWERGKGLGKEENGITEAIKVKIKCDKGGMGHKEGEQFTFHWWDHVFNKASTSLAVESAEDGVRVKKVAEKEGAEGLVSNKKPCKAALSKAKLYGHFVKSATLMSGQEHAEKKASSSEDSSSSDEDQRLDLSTTCRLSDEDLIKACGGRTAHKGARHGLRMSAKLARLEQQEKEFLEKYGKNRKPADSPGKMASCSAVPGWDKEEDQEEGEEMEGKLEKTKKKKKRSKESLEEAVAESVNNTVVNKKKRRKKHSKEMCDSPALGEPSDERGHVHPAKKKCSGKEKMTVCNEGTGSSKNGVTLYASKDYKDEDAFIGVLEDDGAGQEEKVEQCLGGLDEEQFAEAAVPDEDSICQTKKKKKKKNITSDVTEQMQDEEIPDQQSARKKGRSREEEGAEDETAAVRRSKKKKKAKEVGH